MGVVSRGRLPWALGLLLLGGCSYPVREEADLLVCEKAAHAIDPQPAVDESSRTPAAPSNATGIQHTSAEKQMTSEPRREETNKMLERLRFPPELPGANVPDIRLPSSEVPRVRNAALDKLYPALPPLGEDREPPPGPNGLPLTLADLQQLAMSNSPLLRQAAADVKAAEGAAIQAGAYPNPNFGYQSDTAGTSGTAGYQGLFFEQMIKTAGKLKLAQAAATMELLNAQLALRRAQTDLMAQVPRAGYFAVLVAQENVRVARGLTRFTDEAFRIQVDQVKAGPAAPYEPMQQRVLAWQARGTLLQARNRYTAAWKQLAAVMGLPALPPTALAGRVDTPIPVFHWDTALARVLSQHTDVLTAETTLQRARYNLRLQQVTPIPDVSLHLAIEKDFTMPPFSIVHSVQLGVPLPVWDRNGGGIMQAQGQLLRAVEEGHRVRDDLTSRLAEAFERYEDNRKLLQVYRDQILPDQVRVYRGVVQRHQDDPNAVSFGDVITAQQTLAGALTTYLTTLGAQWIAVVDVANLLQTNDLFEMSGGEKQCVGPLPELPCYHPCSPLPEAGLKGADLSWPPANPEEQAPSAPPTGPSELPTPLPPDQEVKGTELLSPSPEEEQRAKALVPLRTLLRSQRRSLPPLREPVRIVTEPEG